MSQNEIKLINYAKSLVGTVKSQRSSRSRNSRRSRRSRSRLKAADFLSAGLALPTSGGSTRSSRPRRRSARSKTGVSGSFNIPATVGFSSEVKDSSFVSTSLKPNGHGAGSNFPFSGNFVQVRTDSNPSNYIWQLPLGFGSINPYITSGFTSDITPDGLTNYSGFLVHPALLNERLATESYRWTEYRFKWLRFAFKPYCGTNNNGSITFAFTRDPTSFIEATNNNSFPVPDLNALTSTIPNLTVSVFAPGSLLINNFPADYKPCEFNFGTLPSTHTQYDYLAYIRTNCAGRLAALYSGLNQSTYYGNLWVEGEVEFRGPKSNSLSVGATVFPLVPPEKTYRHLCCLKDKSWVHHRTKDSKEFKVRDTIKLGSSTPLPEVIKPRSEDGKSTEIISKSSTISKIGKRTHWEEDEPSP